MKIVYCEQWRRMRKAVRAVITPEQAKTRFDDKSGFTAVLYKYSDDAPSHFIEFFDSGNLSVSVLDEASDEMATLTYQFISGHEDIDETRLFLVRMVVREKDANGKQTCGTAYNPVLLIDGKWEIQHHVFCEEDDFVNNTSSNYYTENTVDQESLYKPIPHFGDWEPLISNTEMRFIDE